MQEEMGENSTRSIGILKILLCAQKFQFEM